MLLPTAKACHNKVFHFIFKRVFNQVLIRGLYLHLGQRFNQLDLFQRKMIINGRVIALLLLANLTYKDFESLDSLLKHFSFI